MKTVNEVLDDLLNWLGAWAPGWEMEQIQQELDSLDLGPDALGQHSLDVAEQ